jgi:hypothetical protein
MKAGHVNRGNYSYISVLNMLARYDSDLHNHFESSTVFRGSLDIQHELIHFIYELMTMEIKQEISNANFVSLILDQSSDVMMKCPSICDKNIKTEMEKKNCVTTARENLDDSLLRFKLKREMNT